MAYTAFKHAAWNPLHSIGIHCATMHGIHCNQSESTAPHCMESTAFNRDPLGHAAWNPLHSIGIHLTPLHGIQCINWDAFYHAAWNPLHSMTLHGIHCINRDAFYHAAWNPLHSIWIHCAKMHGIHFVQSKSIAPHCMESTAFSRDPMGHAASNPLHSIGIHLSRCMDTLGSIGMHFTMLHRIHCIQ